MFQTKTPSLLAAGNRTAHRCAAAAQARFPRCGVGNSIGVRRSLTAPVSPFQAEDGWGSDGALFFFYSALFSFSGLVSLRCAALHVLHRRDIDALTGDVCTYIHASSPRTALLHHPRGRQVRRDLAYLFALPLPQSGFCWLGEMWWGDLLTVLVCVLVTWYSCWW